MTDEWESDPPVLMNRHKHHAGFLRERCRVLAADLETSERDMLRALADELLVVGTSLMDWYVGPMAPAAIARTVCEALERDCALAEPAYRAWLGARAFRTITFDDSTVWCVRGAYDDTPTDRYIHVHPGRWTPQTLRVRANTLRSVALLLALAMRRGETARLREPDSDATLMLANEARAAVGLSPMPSLTDGDRLPEVLAVLAGE